MYYRTRKADVPASERANEPDCFERDGAVYASSLDVAEYFGKDHRTVLASLKQAIEYTGNWGLHNFLHTPYQHPQNGQEYASFSMTRDGFTFAVLGFTGAKAAQFKVKYIERFKAMEQALRDAADTIQAQAYTIEDLRAAMAAQASVLAEITGKVDS